MNKKISSWNATTPLWPCLHCPPRYHGNSCHSRVCPVVFTQLYEVKHGLPPNRKNSICFTTLIMFHNPVNVIFTFSPMLLLRRGDSLTLWVTVFGQGSDKTTWGFLFSPQRPRIAELVVYPALSLSRSTGPLSQTHTVHRSVDTTEWWWVIIERVPFDPSSLYGSLSARIIFPNAKFLSICLPACQTFRPLRLSASLSPEFHTPVHPRHLRLCLF